MKSKEELILDYEEMARQYAMLCPIKDEDRRSKLMHTMNNTKMIIDFYGMLKTKGKKK